MRGRRLGFSGCRVSVWDDEKGLEMNSGDSCPKMVNVLIATELYT